MSSDGKAGLGVWLSTSLAITSPEFQLRHQGNSGKPSGTEDAPLSTTQTASCSLCSQSQNTDCQPTSQLNLASGGVEAPGS